MNLQQDILYSTEKECLLDVYLPGKNKNGSIFVFFHSGGLELGDKTDNQTAFSALRETGKSVYAQILQEFLKEVKKL